MISVKDLSRVLRTHRTTLLRVVKNAQQDPRSPLREGKHYRFVDGRLKVTDGSLFVRAYRLHLAHRDSQNGVSLTQFCREQKLNAAKIKDFIESHQETLRSEDLISRSGKGWRIIKPSFFMEKILDQLQPVNLPANNDS